MRLYTRELCVTTVYPKALKRDNLVKRLGGSSKQCVVMELVKKEPELWSLVCVKRPRGEFEVSSTDNFTPFNDTHNQFK